MQRKPLADWHAIVESRDMAGLADLLAPDVVFHSPVVHTPQTGRTITVKYLTAALHVLNNEHFRYVNEFTSGRMACLAVLDIDHFKRINDRLGHLYGDEVLLLFSRLMRECFRDNDLLFRFGGEEFVVVLHDIARSQAAAVFERFRRKLEGRAFPQVGTVTVSTGFVAIGAQDLPSTIIQQADAALYHAKHTGRNRVCCHEELIAAGDLSTVQFESELTLF